MPVRRPAARPDPPGADAAARRLALIAADLGVARPAVASATDAEPESAVSGAGSGAARAEAVEPWWADHTRVAVRGSGDGQGAGVAPERGTGGAPALPVPGRHAARRRRPGPGGALVPVAARLPGLGPHQVAVVAIAVALGLALTTWWVLRDRPGPLAPVSAEPAAPLVTGPAGAPSAVPSATPSAGAERAGGAGAGAAGAAGPAATVTVDVAGKVRRPGIVVLGVGARVTDAVAAAGGARKGVDLTPLNLARVLVDGEQVVVGASAAASTGSAGTAGSTGAAGGASSGPLVNLNTAGQAELETLPRVGPVTAQAIIDWRASRGGFTSVDELLEIDGIGDKTLAQIAPHVTV